MLRDWEAAALNKINFWTHGTLEANASLHRCENGFQYVLVRLIPQGAAKLNDPGPEEMQRREKMEEHIKALFEQGDAKIAIKAATDSLVFSDLGRDERRRIAGAASLCDIRMGGKDPFEGNGSEPAVSDEEFCLRISASNAAFGLARIAESLRHLQSAGLLAGWSASFECQPADLEQLGAAFESKAHLVSLGQFECKSGKLWASDPCYEQDPDLGAHLKGAKGSWSAWSTRRGCGDWGDRCSSILIVRDGDDPLEWLAGTRSGWERAGHCSVDSGQAGFFDAKSFKGEGGEDEDFYRGCTGATLGFTGAGVHPNGMGCASSSGDGDGGYTIVAAYENGQISAARILFYEPTHEEEHAWKKALAEKEAAALGKAADPAPKRSVPGL